MDRQGKSDRLIVPKKALNKAGELAAEAKEGRGLAKRNPQERDTIRTQGREVVNSALERVRQAAGERKGEKFTALLHHVYEVEMLREAYYALERRAAPGVDGKTWGAYGEELEENLQSLSLRLKSGAYRASPVRRVNIPKAGGGSRPLGVTVVEDKIVQRATAAVLEAIYEQDFCRVQLWVSAREECASSVGSTGSRLDDEESELGAGRGHTWVLRGHRP